MANNSRTKVLHASGAETLDISGPVVEFAPEAGIFTLVVTAQAGTTPTFDLDIEEFDEASGTWVVAGSFTQVLETTPTERIVINPVGNKLRATWLITGAAGSYTFSLSATGKE